MALTKGQDILKAINELTLELHSMPDGWENRTLETYLEAMGAWLYDSGRYNDEQPSWDLILLLLQAGKMYE